MSSPDYISSPANTRIIYCESHSNFQNLSTDGEQLDKTVKFPEGTSGIGEKIIEKLGGNRKQYRPRCLMHFFYQLGKIKKHAVKVKCT